MSLNMHLNSNNVYSNIFSTEQLLNMNTFDAMYEDDDHHNQIEQFIPIANTHDDNSMPIMSQNINIDNELHQQHQHNFCNSDAVDQNLTKNISNLNQILSMTSFDDFNANNENHSSLNNNKSAAKMLMMNAQHYLNENHLNTNKACQMISLSKCSSDEVNEFDEPNVSNFKIKDSSFGMSLALSQD